MCLGCGVGIDDEPLKEAMPSRSGNCEPRLLMVLSVPLLGILIFKTGQSLGSNEKPGKGRKSPGNKEFLQAISGMI